MLPPLPSVPVAALVAPTPAALDSLSAVRHDRIVPVPLP